MPLGGWYPDGGLLESREVTGAIWGGEKGDLYLLIWDYVKLPQGFAGWPGEKYWPGTQVRSIKAQR